MEQNANHTGNQFTSMLDNQFANRFDAFTSFNTNNNANDSLLRELNQSGPRDRGNDNEIDNYLSGDNFAFIHQKLSEATSLNASYAQRESHLKNSIDQMNKEKHDFSQKCEVLISQQQTARNKQSLMEQKLDAETRQRFLYQDKVSVLQKDLEEEKKNRKMAEEKISKLQTSLLTEVGTAKKIYKIAEASAIQIETLKDESAILEEMSIAYKSSLDKVKEENEKLYSELEFLNSQFRELGNTFREAIDDIRTYKQESTKLETYIKQTLDRFKEISGYFGNMKDQYLLQQEALEKYQNDTSVQSLTIQEMKGQISDKTNQIEKIKETSALREMQLDKSVEKLEDTLNGLTSVRIELEEKNKNAEEMVTTLREDNIKCKAQVESVKSILCVERNHLIEKKSYLENLSMERDEWKQRYEIMLKKADELDKIEKELNKQNETYKNQISTMQDEIKIGQNTISTIQNENKWLTTEKDRITKEEETKKEEIQTLVNESNDTEVLLKRKNNELLQLGSEINEIKRGKQTLQKENNDLISEVNNLKASDEDLHKKIKEFEERLIKCQFLFMENDKKYEDLADKCTGLEEEKKDNGKSLSSLTEEIRLLEAECHESNKMKEELETTLNNSETNVKKHGENAKMLNTEFQSELEKMRCECEQKQQLIANLTSKESRNKINSDEKNLKITKAKEQITALRGKNESLSESMLRISDEKQEYIRIIENFTTKEGLLKKEIDVKILQVKDLEFLMNEQKREFEQYKLCVDNYDSLWQSERVQALKELQDELARDHKIFQQLAVVGTPMQEVGCTHLTER